MPRSRSGSEASDQSEDTPVRRKGGRRSPSASKSRSRSSSGEDPGQTGETKVIKVRGLPYDCKPKEVAKFFDDCKIVGGDAGVFFPTNEKGMVTGEAFVELAGQKYLDRALERHKQSLGERYLEVFESRKAVMDRARRNDGRGEEDLKDRMRRGRGGAPDRGGDRGLGRGGDRVRSRSRGRGRRGRSEERGGRGGRGSFEDNRGGGSSGYCVKLRGLPWETRKEDVKEFLERVRYKTIVLEEDERGRAAGQAWVELESREEMERALDMHRKHLGSRYIEVFESNASDMDRAIRTFGSGGRGGAGDRRGGGGGDRDRRGGRPRGYVVKLNGLPFRASEREIEDWLAEAADPLEVVIEMDRNGRPSGRADAIFASSREARRAAEKMHRRDLGSRYIECFFDDGGY